MCITLWHFIELLRKFLRKFVLKSHFIISLFFYCPYQVICSSLTCPLFHLRCRKSKTKPNGKKPPAEEKKQYLELEYTKIRVVDFDLKELVVLPREIDLNEWLASNSE